MSEGKILVKLVRSPIGQPGKVKAWLAGLGLKRPNRTVILKDTPEVRGMLAKVPHMIEWTDMEGKKTVKKVKKSKPSISREEKKKDQEKQVTFKDTEETEKDAESVETGSGI